MIGTVLEYEIALLFWFFSILALVLINVLFFVIRKIKTGRKALSVKQEMPAVISTPSPEATISISEPVVKVESVNGTTRLAKTKFWLEQKLQKLKLPKFKLPSFKGKKINFKPSFKLKGKIVIIIINIIFLAFIAFGAKELFFISPGVQYSYPTDNLIIEEYDQPIYVVFDRPINEEMIKPYIFPEIKGEWKVEALYEEFAFSKRKVVFYPEESMFESNVIVYIAGVRDMLGFTETWEYGIDAFSIPLANKAEASSDNMAIDFPINAGVDFFFDKNNGKFVDYEFEITPQVDFTYDYNTDNTLQIVFKNNLAQSTKYAFNLYQIPQRYNLESGEIVEKGTREIIKTGEFVTIKEPLLKSISPSGGELLTSSQILIVFDQQMDFNSLKSKFAITPALNGELVQNDEFTFEYKHKGLAKETQYQISIQPGVQSLKGGISENLVQHSFTSIGKAYVTAFSPRNNSSSISRAANISVSFNHQVDHASAESKFSMSPAIAGVFSWSGNTLIFNPTVDMPYSTTFTIVIGAGVKSIHGIDSQGTFSTKFSTEQQVVSLNVPVYKQPSRFACNYTAAAMAIAYKRGSSVSPMGLYNSGPKDGTPLSCDGSGNVATWGNPYSGFVGNINGGTVSGCNRSGGYGIYWGPLSGVISGYRSNSVRQGWDLTSLLSEVEAGNPVIVYAHNGLSGSGGVFYWTTPGGTSVRAVQGMHSYVVRGFVGPKDNPSSIILNDPYRGKWTISASYFRQLWSYFNYTAIVVY